MGLKCLDFGLFGSGKTGFAATMAEICDIGVIDTEQRWQHYTDPHPTAKPKVPSAAAIKAGCPPLIYANPRILISRPDLTWLPKTNHIIWLVQTMDPNIAWECRKIWATDPTIGGQVVDSASVLWDMLQDSRDTENEKLGGLSWAPVKRLDRRMTYTNVNSGQHYIANCHKQELMDKEMHIIGSRPWAEKRSGHWFDLVLQFVFSSEDKAPKLRVDEEKILGGVAGALKKGTIIDGGPTFKQILTRAGGDRSVVTKMESIEQVEISTQKLVNQTASSPSIPGVDSPVSKGGTQ